MAASTWAGVISAFAGVITAVGGLVAVLGVFLPILRGVREVHKIVNQEKTDRDNFNRALIRALNDAGVAVPVDQSQEDPPA